MNAKSNFGRVDLRCWANWIANGKPWPHACRVDSCDYCERYDCSGPRLFHTVCM